MDVEEKQWYTNNGARKPSWLLAFLLPIYVLKIVCVGLLPILGAIALIKYIIADLL